MSKIFEFTKKVARNRVVGAFAVGMAATAGCYVGAKLFKTDKTEPSSKAVWTEIIHDCDKQGCMRYRYTFRHPAGTELKRFSVTYPKPLSEEEFYSVTSKTDFYERLSAALDIDGAKDLTLD